MRRLVAVSLLATLPLVGFFGCSAAGGTATDGGQGGAAGTGGAAAGGAAAGGKGGAFSGVGGSGGASTATVHLKGKVVAPEGTIPISGALVYLTNSMPPPIPDGVFCDECVHLSGAFTTTNPDGTFDLSANGPGDTLLVVQKGAFRRVRPITLVSGDQDVPLDLTTMPSKMDKANGDDIPKIAIVLGAWDPIEIVLARMGLAATVTKDGFGKAQVLSKDASSFAIYGLHWPGETSPYPAAITLLTQPSEIEKYHIVFVPCSGSSGSGDTGPKCDGTFAYDKSVFSTLDGFVKKGGRMYVSDWSYEYVRQVFPGFVTWKGEDTTIGSACMAGGGEQPAKVDDKGLSDWLTAQGQTLSSVKDAWTDLDGVHPKMDADAKGAPVTSTPKVWVEASSAPATTSFQHGCGRVLYTTYHTQPTSETNSKLEPQALALLYLILEVGVCIDPPGVPG